MKITRNLTRKLIRERYPNAEIKCIRLLDSDKELFTEREVDKLYFDFHKWAWLTDPKLFKIKLVGWISGNRDCDDWAWWFRGFVTRSASQQSLPAGVSRPIGYIHYAIGGDPDQYHAINNVILSQETRLGWSVLRGEKEIIPVVKELEPQKGHGLKSLTLKERRSCDLVII